MRERSGISFILEIISRMSMKLKISKSAMGRGFM